MKKNLQFTFVILIAVAFGLLSYFIGTIPSLVQAGFIYMGLNFMTLSIYLSEKIRPYLDPIVAPGSLFTNILVGGLAGGGILALSLVGLSIGTPLVPASVESNLRWVIVGLMAPVIEEIACRGALLGLFAFLLSRGKKLTTGRLWIAILLQAFFFMTIHFTAYSFGWYSAPTLSSSFGSLGNVGASLLSAFIFGTIMGYLVSRKKINLLGAIIAHFLVNNFLFLKLSLFF